MTDYAGQKLVMFVVLSVMRRFFVSNWTQTHTHTHNHDNASITRFSECLTCVWRISGLVSVLLKVKGHQLWDTNVLRSYFTAKSHLHPELYEIKPLEDSRAFFYTLVYGETQLPKLLQQYNSVQFICAALFRKRLF